MSPEAVKLSNEIWWETLYSTLYSKSARKMPDWDNLIVRCIANDLINKKKWWEICMVWARNRLCDSHLATMGGGVEGVGKLTPQ